jgi:hypothetical protein
MIAAMLRLHLALSSGTLSSGAHKEASRPSLIGRDNWTAQSPSGNIREYSEIGGFEEKQSELVQRKDFKVTPLEERCKTTLSEEYEMVGEIQWAGVFRTLDIRTVPGYG